MAEPALTLGFDCAGPWCAGAILQGDRVLASRHEAMTKGQAEALMPMLDAMLRENGMAWQNLHLIGVGIGPGNFTGTRIAVAAARGLALALNIPAIGIGACEAAAHNLPRPCRVVLPARRGDVFWQDFTQTDALGKTSSPAQMPADALPPGPAVGTSTTPPAEAIAAIARARYQAVPGHIFPRPAPIYLRPTDAAPPSDPPPQILAG